MARRASGKREADMTRSYISGGLLFLALAASCVVLGGYAAPAEAELQRPAIEMDKPIQAEAVVELVKLAFAAEPEVPEAPELPETPLSDELSAVLAEACEREGVPLEITLAVMEQESGFDPGAVGVDGHDIGLFQLRSSNHAWLTEETGANPMVPEGNIVCGVWFLGYLYDYCDGSWPAALTCWRYGPGHGETSEYASVVLAGAEKWK